MQGEQSASRPTLTRPRRTAEARERATLAPDSRPSGLDVRAWLVWLLAALVAASLAFHPVYLVILIGVAILTWPDEGERAGLLSLRALFRIAIIALVFGAAFNALMVRTGQTVLVDIPGWLPLVGGPVYLEAALFGAINALRLIAILFAFSLFSRAINFADLIRLLPPAFFELGLIVSISFTLAPAMLRAFAEIREAQALRGHRPRGLRDLLPLVSPLVVTGMERALALAEAMEARGYGAPGGQAQRRAARRGQALTLLSLPGFGVAALLMLFGAPGALAWAVFALSAALLALGLVWLSRHTGRTRLRRGRWGRAETLVSLCALTALVAFFGADRSALVVDVYQLAQGAWPGLDPWLGIALVGLSAPGLMAGLSAPEDARQAEERADQPL
ncbi:MAG: hypothetical protein IT323_05745 [Anaerolineae bacterium]|nr:hypothetical protein [Anaerolineae bacterium]